MSDTRKKRITGYAYLITDDGKVYSERSKRYLSLSLARGYPCTHLWKNGKSITVAVHRLVAQAFLAKPAHATEVNHIDKNKLNNHYTNLEWVTRSQNIRHSYANGHTPTRGELAGNSKLTEKQVLEIIGIKDKTYKQIASLYGVGYSTIAHIKVGTRWAHLKNTQKS